MFKKVSLVGRMFDILNKLTLFLFSYADLCIARVTSFAAYLTLSTWISLLPLCFPFFYLPVLFILYLLLSICDSLLSMSVYMSGRWNEKLLCVEVYVMGDKAFLPNNRSFSVPLLEHPEFMVLWNEELPSIRKGVIGARVLWHRS